MLLQEELLSSWEAIISSNVNPSNSQNNVKLSQNRKRYLGGIWGVYKATPPQQEKQNRRL